MAAAVAPEKRSADELIDDLAEHLADDVHLVADVLPKFSERVLGLAWLKGVIEFGRLNCTRTGQPEAPQGESCSRRKGWILILETGTTWTGDKKVWHKRIGDLLAEDTEPMEYLLYQKYVPSEAKDAEGKAIEGQMKRVEIKRAEAEAALRLRVRLTEKGLALLRA